MPSMPFSTADQHSDMTVTRGQVQPHWYAAYTCANHEKPVAAELLARGVEHFLPLYSSVRRWKDRRVRLDLPLFPGYVFVRLALVERLRVLQIPRVVRLVGFSGMPAALPDEQVEILRAGLAGVLLRTKGNFRFVLSVELIQRSLSVDVDAADVQPLGELKRSLPGLPISPLADKLS
jgi:transcription antitermination factor NusG